MAGQSRARLNPRNAEQVRQRIKAAHIVERLQKHHDGDLELTDSQISVGQFLVAYVLPKPVQQVEQTGTLTIKWQ
jgi:hypothetical protein